MAGLLCLPATPLSAGGWTIDSVDAVGIAVQYTSMKIDAQGNVHVAYVLNDNNHYPLRYAFWDHALKKWFVMTVDQNAGTCSLALDSKQHPHIAFTDFAGGRLRYAHWDGSKWDHETLPINAQNINYYQSIALTPGDRPNIVFYEYEGPRGSDYKIRLRIVQWDGKNWALRTLDSDQGSGKFNSMVVDQQGHLHIAYANVSATTGGMRYAYWDGKDWKIEILEGEKENHGHGVGWSCNIAVDKDSIPHMTYMDEVEKLVKYAVRRNNKWQIQVIGKVTGVAYPDRNSIAIDRNGVPYVGFFDGGSGSLEVEHPEGQKWVIETVDADNAGFTSSMQIDNNNVAWISYADGANGGIKVAHRQLSSLPAAATGAAQATAAMQNEPKK